MTLFVVVQVSLRSLQQSVAAIAADKGGRDGLAGGFADGRAREMHWHAQPVGLPPAPPRAPPRPPSRGGARGRSHV